MSEQESAQWRLESARLTVFLNSAVASSVDDWFETVLGVSPDRSEIRRSEGIRVDTGAIDNNRVTLQIQLNRIDWSVAARDAALDFGDSEIGPAASLHKVVDGYGPWLAKLDGVVRVAVGGVFRAKSSGKAESYALLQQMLPSIKLDPDSSEFSYRINRPRNRDIGGAQVLVNRISSWSAIVIQQIVQTIGSASPGAAEIRDVAHWARCEVDISTDAHSSEPLSPELRAEVAAALSEVALEIIRDGDR